MKQSSWWRIGVLMILVGTLGLPAGQRVWAQQGDQPTAVTIPGSFQSEVGCAGDWQPTCDQTTLVYDPTADLWVASFDLPAGDFEYKVAINKAWDENYGANGARGGANIPLTLAAPATIKFYYDHKTHVVINNHNSLVALAVGNFQSELGCTSDTTVDCLRTLLQDSDGDGIYGFSTTALPAGNYEVKVAINESLEETYGAEGVKNGPSLPFTIAKDGDEVYFGYDAATHALVIDRAAPRGDLGVAQALWVARDAIMWKVLGSPTYSYSLHYAPSGGLRLTGAGVEGGEILPLSFSASGPGAAASAKFPHTAGFATLKLDPADLAKVPELVKAQLAVAVRDDQGKPLDASAVQLPGVLDDLFAYDGPLGVSYAAGVPTLRVWAPTTRRVALHLFADSQPATQSITVPMTLDPQTGVWSATGEASWTNQFYLYEVAVFVRATGQIETNLVTDPYAISLALNSTRSQIVDVSAANLKPAGWDTLPKPALAAPEDIVLYELHVRDFSAFDDTVPAAERGTFRAFTRTEAAGMRHLKRLAAAGLTHVHLLPVFDIATIEEDRSKRQEPDRASLIDLPPDSEQQQALIEPLRDRDAFNWGYDPFHYSVPEGSYATEPDGSARIVEFREMVQALNQSGLRVVMDVVYNHTNASGQNQQAVLDRIVPGYYHRLNAKGEVETSTCCQNTATEHAMMEKLMIDSVVLWATAYKIDGFRFDLMGHHMKANMLKLRAALDALTVANAGVDGSQIYVYGEGWNFGEVASNARGENATQLNMAGSGIGTFSDRLRDAVRGGGPFSGLQEQGFGSGLFTLPNSTDQGSVEDQKARLLLLSDQIKIGLAGNLKDFALVDRSGQEVTGDVVRYNNQPTGYALDPQETITYVSAHDNETLFDAIQLKAPPTASMTERVRLHNLALSIVALSQGVPFFHAGDELLRSKSLDRNSYNSGDWFNRLDWSYQTNNWGVGLPPRENQPNWPIMQALLANPALRPAPADIANALASFETMLQIRKSSPLFRLRTAAEIQAQVRFLTSGPDQVPGLIVMLLANGPTTIDPAYGQIVVLFNATASAQTFRDTSLDGAAWTLHPAQVAASDPVLKTASFAADTNSFKVPGLTTAVFVAPPAAQPAATELPALTATATSNPPAPTTTSAPAATATPAPASGGSSRFGMWLALGVAIFSALLASSVAYAAAKKRNEK